MGKIEQFTPLLGRVMLALIFVMSGFGKIASWDQTAGYMASKGMPIVPLFLVGAIIVEIAGGLSVMLGWKAKIGAAALFIFLIPTTLIFHNFWAVEGMDHQVQMIMFLKNISIMGGLALVTGFGPGPISLDNRNNQGRV